VSELAASANVGARTIFTGFGLGVIYNIAMKALHGWKDTPEKVFDAPLKGGSIACEITPELLGVGYVIGPRIAAVMAAGGVLSYLLLIPLIKFFGEGLAGPLAPGSVPIADMSPKPDSRRLHSLHRRGRSRGGRHHQPAALAPPHLARHPGRLAGLRRKEGGQRVRAAHRS
jgi:hypothetical protein